MEGASKRIIPSFFQKRNPGNDAESAISRKQPPEDTPNDTPATAINAPPAPTLDYPPIRPAGSQAPASCEPSKRRAQSPADGLSDFVDQYRLAENDVEAGTQRHIDSGDIQSNTRSAIYTLTPNSTPDSDNSSDNEDNSLSTSQIRLIHRQASNRNRRKKQLRKEKSNQIQDGNDVNEIANAEMESNTSPGARPPNSAVTRPLVGDAIDQ